MGVNLTVAHIAIYYSISDSWEACLSSERIAGRVYVRPAQYADILRNILQALQNTYTRSLGFEFMHIMNLEERVWLQNRIEPNRAQDQLTPQKLQILDYLTAAEGFEQYLHRRYVGQKRFGLEGGIESNSCCKP